MSLLSPLHFRDKTGNCTSFQDHFLKPSIAKINSKIVWHCRNRTIDMRHFNDIMPDCYESEDEPLLTSLFQEKYSEGSMCPLPGQLPCFEGHSHCFSVSDICVYSLDISGHLYPCRTGAHLMVCENFTCNNKYKCPGYYCLRFGYLCDGKTDCPFGEDEVDCDNISDCKYMYRCRESRQCIHLVDICDNYTDCNYGDDERQCQLNGVQCPIGCVCLHFALSCIQLDMNKHEESKVILPYVSLVIKNQHIDTIKNIFNTFQ